MVKSKPQKDGGKVAYHKNLLLGGGGRIAGQ